ncbi:MAG: DNA-3-methyladenine glycosylase 2 family protein [Pseudomonadota bacterium]
MTAPTAEQLHQACEALSIQDPILARAFAETGLPRWRTTEPTYAALARIVVYQLISTKAADAIWARFQAMLPDVTAPAVLAADREIMRSCGLSRPKLEHLLAIAQAVQSGAVNFNALAGSPHEDARQTLLDVRGIGPWTADTFLMTALGHMDAFPHGDVGLIEAYRRLSGAEDRLPSKQFSKHAEHWRPHRAVAAHLLYDWYNAHR